MRILIRRVIKNDPSSFIGSFGVWGMLVGTSLMVPGDVFDRNIIYAAVQSIHKSEYVWGSILFASGLTLVVSLRLNPVPPRALIAAMSSFIWMMFGMLVVYSGTQAGYLSIVGVYSMLGAIGCAMASEQYVRHEKVY